MSQADTAHPPEPHERGAPDEIPRSSPLDRAERALQDWLIRVFFRGVVRPIRWLTGSVGLRSVALTALELLVLLAWALFITWPYADMQPNVVARGPEFLHHIQSNHLWDRVKECGPCAFWNGGLRGGYPALVDPQSSALHPLVMLTTLGWGVVNGSKLSIIGAFFMAGVAQWWLGRVVGVGRVVAVWGGAMAIAAGHLGARMEHGLFPVVISMAACSLVFPALVLFARSATRRTAVLLGVVLALAGVSGQGYFQIGLLFIVPAALLLVPFERAALLRTARWFALAVVLAVLLAAPFLVPFFHFLPNFEKMRDPGLPAAQPLGFAALNLVIDDYEFYRSEMFSKYPFPSIYVIFVGWIPVLLALVGLRGTAQRWGRGVVAFLAAAVVMSFVLASALPFFWLIEWFPALTETVEGLRFVPLMSSLAIPPLLGLAMIGLREVLDLRWPWLPRLVGPPDRQPARGIRATVRWLVLAVPALLALHTAHTFSDRWIGVTELNPILYEEIELLRPDDLQWVSKPYASHFWVQPSISRGLKLSEGTQVWFWKGRDVPLPMRFTIYDGMGDGMNPYGELPPGTHLLHKSGALNIYEAPPGEEYAAVTHRDGSRTVCRAQGTGGDIDVFCDLARGGMLTVKENSWVGWHAWLDGEALPLGSGQWLRVEVPPGEHVVAFRYRPWDASLGLGLFGAGVVVAGIMLWRRG
jgi:hypothetical protein